MKKIFCGNAEISVRAQNVHEKKGTNEAKWKSLSLLQFLSWKVFFLASSREAKFTWIHRIIGYFICIVHWFHAKYKYRVVWAFFDLHFSNNWTLKLRLCRLTNALTRDIRPLLSVGPFALHNSADVSLFHLFAFNICNEYSCMCKYFTSVACVPNGFGDIYDFSFHASTNEILLRIAEQISTMKCSNKT